MDIDIRFLDKLTYPDDKDLFEHAFSILVHKSDQNNAELKNYRTLTKEDKVKITKIYQFLTNAAFAFRQKGDQGAEGLQQSLEKSQYKGLVFDLLKRIEFDKALNNYRLIKMRGDEGENKKIVQADLSYEAALNNFVRMEWKIEIILSSMAIRKVLRPVVVMVIHTKEGRKSFYIEIAQFQELRKNFALMIRQLHQIELKNAN